MFVEVFCPAVIPVIVSLSLFIAPFMWAPLIYKTFSSLLWPHECAFFLHRAWVTSLRSTYRNDAFFFFCLVVLLKWSKAREAGGWAEWSIHSIYSPPWRGFFFPLVQLQTLYLEHGGSWIFSKGSTVCYYAATINVCPLHVHTLISLLLYQTACWTVQARALNHCWYCSLTLCCSELCEV